MTEFRHKRNQEMKVEIWENGVEVYRRQHPSYMNEKDVEKYGIDQVVGRRQFLHRKEDIEISLIELKTGFEDNWEIYQNSGEKQLLEDVERFSTKEESQDRIYELMSE